MIRVCWNYSTAKKAVLNGPPLCLWEQEVSVTLLVAFMPCYASGIEVPDGQTPRFVRNEIKKELEHERSRQNTSLMMILKRRENIKDLWIKNTPFNPDNHRTSIPPASQ